MQVNHVSDIYSNLGRLDRQQGGPAERPDYPAIAHPVESQSPPPPPEQNEILQASPTETDEPTLTTHLASALTEILAERIASWESPSFPDAVHDPVGASIIRPRYV